MLEGAVAVAAERVDGTPVAQRWLEKRTTLRV